MTIRKRPSPELLRALAKLLLTRSAREEPAPKTMADMLAMFREIEQQMPDTAEVEQDLIDRATKLAKQDAGKEIDWRWLFGGVRSTVTQPEDQSPALTEQQRNNAARVAFARLLVDDVLGPLGPMPDLMTDELVAQDAEMVGTPGTVTRLTADEVDLVREALRSMRYDLLRWHRHTGTEAQVEAVEKIGKIIDKLTP